MQVTTWSNQLSETAKWVDTALGQIIDDVQEIDRISGQTVSGSDTENIVLANLGQGFSELGAHELTLDTCSEKILVAPAALSWAIWASRPARWSVVEERA